MLIFLILLHLLFTTHQATAYIYNDTVKFHAVTGVANITLSIVGNYVKTTRNVTIYNAVESHTISILNITTEPCRIIHQRVEACDYLNVVYNVYNLVWHQTCENPPTPCLDAYDWSLACPPLNSSNICRTVQCMMAIKRPQGDCFADYQSFQGNVLNGYTCGTNLYCNNEMCVDARGDECRTTIKFTVSEPFLTPGLYYVRTDNSSNMSPFPILQVFAAPNLVSATAVASAGTPLNPVFAPVLFNVSSYVLVVNTTDCAAGDVMPDMDSIMSASQMTFPVSTRVSYESLLVSAFITFVIPSNVTILAVKLPVMYDLCPGLALSYLNTTVVVQGDYFYDNPLLQCVFDGNPAPILVLSPNVMHCLIYPEIGTTANLPLTITNDGVSYARADLFVSIIGSCQIIKPNSVPTVTGCQCVAGYQESNDNCLACADGWYQPLAGQQTCIPCDSSENTNGTVGNTAKSACQCRDGRFRENPTDVSCSQCGMGLICEGGRVDVQRGYWRWNQSDTRVIPCVEPEFCAGGSGSQDQLCSKGYSGPMCNVCSDGFGKINGKCVSCSAASVSILIVVLIILAIIVVVALLVKYTTSTTTTTVGANQRGTVGTLLKIIISYLQLLYYIGQITAGWSNNTKSFFNLFLPVSLSSSFLSFQCAMPVSFYTHIALVMVTPILVTVALAAFFLVARVLWAKYNYFSFYKFVQVLLIVLYLVHPTIALEILQSLRCEVVPATSPNEKPHSFVRNNMEVDCESGSYQSYRGVAIVYLLLYIVGSCIYITIDIRKHADDVYFVLNGGTSSQWAMVYAYFAKGYSKNHLEWEAVILYRKLLVVAASALLSSGLQLVWTAVAIIVNMAVHIYFKPYESVIDNYLDTVAMIALSISVLLGFHSVFIGPSSGTAVFALMLIINVSAFVLILSATLKRIKKFIEHVVNTISSMTKDRNIFGYGNTAGQSDISGITMNSREGAVMKELERM